jgi:hypothetical protein
VRRHLGSQSRLKLMRQLAWWLWTDKKTRTFSAMEVPQEIIQQFRVPGISDDGMRRELLVGSIVEERNVGHFLSEKQAGLSRTASLAKIQFSSHVICQSPLTEILRL